MNLCGTELHKIEKSVSLVMSFQKKSSLSFTVFLIGPTAYSLQLYSS